MTPHRPHVSAEPTSDGAAYFMETRSAHTSDDDGGAADPKTAVGQQVAPAVKGRASRSLETTDRRRASTSEGPRSPHIIRVEPEASQMLRALGDDVGMAPATVLSHLLTDRLTEMLTIYQSDGPLAAVQYVMEIRAKSHGRRIQR